MSVSSNYHIESSYITVIGESHFSTDDGTGLPSRHSVTPSFMLVNVSQSEAEETKDFSLAKDFEER